MKKFVGKIGALAFAFVAVVAGLSLVPKTEAKADTAQVTVSGTYLVNGIGGYWSYSYTVNGVALVDGADYVNGVKYDGSTGTIYVNADSFNGNVVFTLNGQINKIKNASENSTPTINIADYVQVYTVEENTPINENGGTINTLKSDLVTNKQGASIATVNQYVNIGTNAGTINQYDGYEIGTNSGQIVACNGYVEVNTNTGRIINNDGGVLYNRGIIHNNTGEVGYNEAAATVYDNTGCIYDNAGTVDNNGASGEVYHNTGVVTTNNGFVTTEKNPNYAGSDESDPYSESIDACINNLKNIEGMISRGEITGERTVYYNEGGALPVSIMKTLKNCPSITLDFTCTYEGKEYHFAIKGGNDMKLDTTIPWYGPLYLQAVYGVAGN